SALTFIVHELLDVVAALQRFGPIRSWWMFHFERVNHSIKTLCPKGGGRSNDMTVITRYEALEYAAFQQFASDSADRDDNNTDNDREALCGLAPLTGEAELSNPFRSPKLFYWLDLHILKLLQSMQEAWLRKHPSRENTA